MAFDKKAFISAKFEPRTMDYPVPGLKLFFDNGDKAVWKIRSLTGSEIGRADEAVQNEGFTAKILEAVTSMNSSEVAAQVKELMGRSGDKPQSIKKRIYHLIYGSVEPCLINEKTGEANYEIAVNLCENYPIIFLELTNEILRLSGQGFEPGKSKPSGETKKSS